MQGGKRAQAAGRVARRAVAFAKRLPGRLLLITRHWPLVVDLVPVSQMGVVPVHWELVEQRVHCPCVEQTGVEAFLATHCAPFMHFCSARGTAACQFPLKVRRLAGVRGVGTVRQKQPALKYGDHALVQAEQALRNP